MDTTSESGSTAKLAEDLKVLVHDGEQLLKASAGDLSEKGKEARAKLAAAVESAKTVCADLREKAKAGVKATDEAIREHPYPALGLAFCLGLLIGVLVRRR